MSARSPLMPNTFDKRRGCLAIAALNPGSRGLSRWVLIAAVYPLAFLVALAVFIAATTFLGQAFQLDGSAWMIDLGRWVAAVIFGVVVGMVVGRGVAHRSLGRGLWVVAACWSFGFALLTIAYVIAAPYIAAAGSDGPPDRSLPAMLDLIGYATVFGLALPGAIALGLWLARPSLPLEP